MAFTTSDLATVDAALMTVASGRVARITVGGKTIEYAADTYDNLLKLRGLIVADITSESETAGYRRAQTTVKSDTW